MSSDEPANPIKQQIRADLTAAMKARDAATTGTLRMALAAITTAEVAGEQARQLTDAETIAVLTKEVKKRHEAAEIYSGAGRPELADQENREAEILSAYLPTQLSDDELGELARQAVAEVAAATGQPPTQRQLGQAIKAVQVKAAGRADGARIAAAVRAALG